MAMMKSQAINLANFIHMARPGWDFHGVMAALLRLKDLDPLTAAHTALTAAGDPEAVTPAAMVNSTYRPDWRPASPEMQSAMRVARGNQVADRRALEQIRADHRAADPAGSHRGYLTAVAALEGGKA